MCVCARLHGWFDMLGLSTRIHVFSFEINLCVLKCAWMVEWRLAVVVVAYMAMFLQMCNNIRKQLRVYILQCSYIKHVHVSAMASMARLVTCCVCLRVHFKYVSIIMFVLALVDRPVTC